MDSDRETFKKKVTNLCEKSKIHSKCLLYHHSSKCHPRWIKFPHFVHVTVQRESHKVHTYAPIKVLPHLPPSGQGWGLRREFDTAKINAPDDGAALSINSLLLRLVKRLPLWSQSVKCLAPGVYNSIKSPSKSPSYLCPAGGGWGNCLIGALWNAV